MIRSKKLVVFIFISAVFLTSACSSSIYDQSLNESQALRNCYAGIRDGIVDSIEDCGDYVTFHAPLYPEIDQSIPALAACSFAKNTLAYARINYKLNKLLIRNLESQSEADCTTNHKSQMEQKQRLRPSTTL